MLKMNLYLFLNPKNRSFSPSFFRLCWSKTSLNCICTLFEASPSRNKLCALLVLLWNKFSGFKLCNFYYKIWTVNAVLVLWNVVWQIGVSASSKDSFPQKNVLVFMIIYYCDYFYYNFLWLFHFLLCKALWIPTVYEMCYINKLALPCLYIQMNQTRI